MIIIIINVIQYIYCVYWYVLCHNVIFNIRGQSDFIKDALELRLKMIVPYIESWPQVRYYNIIGLHMTSQL